MPLMKSCFFKINFSSSIIISFIFKPLFAIALRASLLDGSILLFATKSKIFIPFSISSILILISGKFFPNPPFSNVSFAVSSAFLEAISP